MCIVDENKDSRVINFDLVYTLNNQAMFPFVVRLCLVSFTAFEEEKISGFNSS